MTLRHLWLGVAVLQMFAQECAHIKSDSEADWLLSVRGDEWCCKRCFRVEKLWKQSRYCQLMATPLPWLQYIWREFIPMGGGAAAWNKHALECVSSAVHINRVRSITPSVSPHMHSPHRPPKPRMKCTSWIFPHSSQKYPCSGPYFRVVASMLFNIIKYIHITGLCLWAFELSACLITTWFGRQAFGPASSFSHPLAALISSFHKQLDIAFWPAVHRHCLFCSCPIFHVLWFSSIQVSCLLFVAEAHRWSEVACVTMGTGYLTWAYWRVNEGREQLSCVE